MRVSTRNQNFSCWPFQTWTRVSEMDDTECREHTGGKSVKQIQEVLKNFQASLDDLCNEASEKRRYRAYTWMLEHVYSLAIFFKT